jgi:hypothetical protein
VDGAAGLFALVLGQAPADQLRTLLGRGAACSITPSCITTTRSPSVMASS